MAPGTHIDSRPGVDYVSPMTGFLSPRQLRRLTPHLLGLWMVLVLFAGFQPCAVMASTLTEMPAMADMPNCPEAIASLPKQGMEHHYVHCNLPDLATHGQQLETLTLLQPFLPHQMPMLLLPHANWHPLAQHSLPEAPPQTLILDASSGFRLLI